MTDEDEEVPDLMEMKGALKDEDGDNSTIIKTKSDLWIDKRGKYEYLVRGSVKVIARCKCGERVKLSTFDRAKECSNCGHVTKLKI